MKKRPQPKRFKSVSTLIVILVQISLVFSATTINAALIMAKNPSHSSMEMTQTGSSVTSPADDTKSVIKPGRINRGVTGLPVIFSVSPCPAGWDGKDLILTKESAAFLDNNHIRIEPRTFKIDANGNCSAFALVNIARDTKVDKYPVKFAAKDAGDNITQIVELDVLIDSDLTPDPIPPGLDPQVDIMWAVIPKTIVSDNFGPRVAKLFYGIEVVIGNNTGFDLQIAAVGFKLGPVGKAATEMAQTYNDARIQQSQYLQEGLSQIKIKCGGESARLADIMAYTKCVTDKTEEFGQDVERMNNQRVAMAESQSKSLTKLSQLAYADTLPVSSYPITRGVASHGEFWNARSLTINALKAIGPVLTGITPFFNRLITQKKYAQGVNILTNPFAAGIESVFPDEVIPQLQRLDDQILRDGLIISNNRQIRTRAFIPKGLLRLDKKYINDPMVITQALGKLYLIGDQIQYLNRVSVTSGDSGERIPPPTVNPSRNTYELGDINENLELTGTNLKGADIRSASSEIIVSDVDSKSNSAVSAKIAVTKSAALGPHTLFVETSRGSVPISINVINPVASVPLPAGGGISALAIIGVDKNPVSFPLNGVDFQVELTGDFLRKASLVPIEGSPLLASRFNSTSDGTKLTATVTVPPQTKAGVYKFQVQHDDAEDDAPVVSFEVKKRPTPDITATVSNKPITENPIADVTYELTLTGVSLNDTEIKTTSVLVFTPISVSEKQIRINVTVPKETKKGPYPFTLEDKDGVKESYTITVAEQPDINIKSTLPITFKMEPGKTQEFTLDGLNFEGVKDAGTSAPWGVVVVDPPNSSGSILKLRITAPSAEVFKENKTLTITLKNSNGKNKDFQVKVEFLAPAIPAPTP